ncbi:alpha/beta hydrolase [Limosilactobacillus reuteri]|uniref:alpha/beta hydrolase n=1 Tax=Limosilactobacillus reuteri TaxID=1598 RepID=UPI001E2E8DD8|nr:alpha/beta hydrolase [Limosilactobacillus reuteri]MCC4383035.1 alpha/beta hydrolase [Limosilactobacillus reuteri]MCC4411720.1 alpha/beta hydrolase [Limosilactobacillus reuteri]MCC4414347.1 alpha/beta hydrolase [Limosilactobacillus reuteri]MCC4419034.1 alpha/beta hydrolase [Limosilactobacillus reuteri]
MAQFTLNSTVNDVENYFGNAGRLLFPVDRPFNPNETLAQISNSAHYIWYSNIKTNKTVEVLNYLAAEQKKHQIFYPIYSEDEIAAHPSRANTGLYFFRGKEGAPFAINNAGGGFAYVAAMQDSFPHALEISKYGYNAFALIYRPTNPYEDLAQAICFIEDHATELGVNPRHYSLWGGSAGARMAAELGNKEVLYQLTGRSDIPQADAVIMQYTGFSRVSSADAPTYVSVGDNDWIANWRTMKQRLFYLEQLGIPTEFHVYSGLNHGFGLGEGTVAEGWINDAINFWEVNMPD